MAATFERRLFCECGFSIYDDGFQSSFFRHYQPCSVCGRAWSPTAKNVIWREGVAPKNPTFWQRLFKYTEGYWLDREGNRVPPAAPSSDVNVGVVAARKAKNSD